MNDNDTFYHLICVIQSLGWGYLIIEHKETTPWINVAMRYEYNVKIYFIDYGNEMNKCTKVIFISLIMASSGV